MAINLNLPNFLGAPTQQSPLSQLLPGLQEGYMASRVPAQTRLNEQQMRLANALTEAKTNTERMYGGLGKLSGPAAQVESYEIMKRIYGENHPATIRAKELIDANLEHTQASAANMRNLVETAPKRHSTQQGKLGIESYEAEKGFLPGTMAQYSGPFAQVKIDDQTANRMIAQRGLEIAKKTTDDFTRRGLEQALNIHKVRESIDPIALTAYSGIKGGIKGWAEIVKDQFGNPSELYEANQQSQVAAKTMAKQVRQLLKDSISKEADDALNALTNPSSWKVSPEIALKKYQTYMGILDREIETFYNAAEDPATFNRQYGPNKLARSLENNAQKSIAVKSPEGGNLKPPQGSFTKANIMEAAKNKNWSKEKTDFVLKRYGYG